MTEERELVDDARRAPQVTFSSDMRRISRMMSMPIGGRPGFERDFLLQ